MNFLVNFLDELFWWTYMVNLIGELFGWTFWWTSLMNFLVNFFLPIEYFSVAPPSVGALQTRTTEGNVRRIVKRGELVCTVLQTCLGELCRRAAAAKGGAQWFQMKKPARNRMCTVLFKYYKASPSGLNSRIWDVCSPNLRVCPFWTDLIHKNPNKKNGHFYSV